MVRSAAAAEPASFVRRDRLLIIDEVQRGPDLLLAIKHEVDLDPRPGRFLVTGSARLFALRDIPDLLPGRSETIELWPLSQGEIARSSDRFIDAVFEQGSKLNVSESDLRRESHLERFWLVATRRRSGALPPAGRVGSSIPTSRT